MADLSMEAGRLLREIEKEGDPSATIGFPGGVVTNTDQWCTWLGNAVADDSAKRRIADTLTGCETLAWFINRFSTYGAGRSVPAKLLFHQIMDVIHELCELRSGESNFMSCLKKCFTDANEKELVSKILKLWKKIRHRSHLSATRGERDHGFDYFEAIGDAWGYLVEVVSKLGGDFSEYEGLLSKIAGYEKSRATRRQENSEDLF